MAMSFKGGKYELFPAVGTPRFLEALAADPRFAIHAQRAPRHPARSKEEFETMSSAACPSSSSSSKHTTQREFELSMQQSFVQFYLGHLTPYRSLLLFHKPGAGKTCAAITVALDHLRASRGSGAGRVLVLASSALQSNFRRQIFDDARFLAGDGLQGQCTRDAYLRMVPSGPPSGPKGPSGPSESKGQGPNTDATLRRIARLIKTQFVMQGYEEFASALEAMTDEEVATRYSNKLIVVDEAHNLRPSFGDKRTSTQVARLAALGKNNRLLLLTATPMYDAAREIAYLLNLCRANDGKPPIAAADSENPAIIGPASAGYVSYALASDPLVFPARVVDGDLEAYGEKKTKFLDFYGKPMKPGGHAFREGFRVVSCPMSPQQRATYDLAQKHTSPLQLTTQGENGEGEEDDEGVSKKGVNLDADAKSLLRSVQVSNIAFPGATQSTGRPGFTACVRGGPWVGGFSYAPSAGAFLAPAALPKWSAKLHAMAQALDAVRYGPVLAFSEYLYAGVLSLAIALEHRGWVREGGPPLLSPEAAALGREKGAADKKGAQRLRKRYVLITGDYRFTPDLPAAVALVNASTASKAPSSNLSGSEGTEGTVGTKGTEGTEGTEGSTDDADKGAIETIGAGGGAMDEDGTGDETRDGTDGGDVIAALVTSVAGEGVDFRGVREVHLMEPWYNGSKLDQVVGRAIRACSHAHLPIDQRLVTVRFYAATLPTESRRESSDLCMYRLAEGKAQLVADLEAALRAHAVDCALFESAGNTVDPALTLRMTDARGQTVQVNPSSSGSSGSSGSSRSSGSGSRCRAPLPSPSSSSSAQAKEVAPPPFPEHLVPRGEREVEAALRESGSRGSTLADVLAAVQGRLPREVYFDALGRLVASGAVRFDAGIYSMTPQLEATRLKRRELLPEAPAPPLSPLSPIDPAEAFARAMDRIGSYGSIGAPKKSPPMALEYEALKLSRAEASGAALRFLSDPRPLTPLERQVRAALETHGKTLVSVPSAHGKGSTFIDWAAAPLEAWHASPGASGPPGRGHGRGPGRGPGRGQGRGLEAVEPPQNHVDAVRSHAMEKLAKWNADKITYGFLTAARPRRGVEGAAETTVALKLVRFTGRENRQTGFVCEQTSQFRAQDAVAEIEALGQKALAANDKGRHSKRRLCDELGAALLGAGRLLTPLESALAIA